MFEEQRIEPPEQLELPITLSDGLRAMTRDISPTGLFFEIEGERLMRGLVDFEMHLAEAGIRFTAVGEIVRRRVSRGQDRRGRQADGSPVGAHR